MLMNIRLKQLADIIILLQCCQRSLEVLPKAQRTKR